MEPCVLRMVCINGYLVTMKPIIIKSVPILNRYQFNEVLMQTDAIYIHGIRASEANQKVLQQAAYHIVDMNGPLTTSTCQRSIREYIDVAIQRT